MSKDFFSFRNHITEKTLTPAEKKKREEVAKAIERENPGMPMAKKMAIATAQAKKVAEETTYYLEEAKHVVNVTVSDPNHPAVTKRKELIQRRASVTAKDKQSAIDSAIHFYKKQGYKVHDHDYVGLKEEVEPVDELNKSTVVNYINKTVDPVYGIPKTKTKLAQRLKGIQRAHERIVGNKPTSNVKEAVDDEGAMAKGQLMRMVNQASGLARIMNDDTQLDGWVQSKLTLASDYLDSVHDFLMHSKQDVDEKEEGEIEEAKKTKLFGAAKVYDRWDKLTRKETGETLAQRQAWYKKNIEDTLKRKKDLEDAGIIRKEDVHYCAKHVRSALLGDGVVLEAQHADPDDEGQIEWYMVEFKDGIHKVYTEDLDIMLAEYHGNHKKKKRMNDGR